MVGTSWSGSGFAEPRWSARAKIGVELDNAMPAINTIPKPLDLVGTIRRFGPTGPVYEVRRVIDDRNDEQAILVVELPETGEAVEIPYLQAVFDPTEDA